MLYDLSLSFTDFLQKNGLESCILQNAELPIHFTSVIIKKELCKKR